MNNRLKELAIQSKIKTAIAFRVWGTIDALTDSEQEDLAQIEKFAELIVRECANRASWAQDTGAVDIGGEVLKHFGVEE
jgi:hypothetical protein